MASHEGTLLGPRIGLAERELVPVRGLHGLLRQQ